MPCNHTSFTMPIKRQMKAIIDSSRNKYRFHDNIDIDITSDVNNGTFDMWHMLEALKLYGIVYGCIV